MNGIHDMVGMHGFGPVEREEDEPVFHSPWEGRVLGMRRLLPGLSGGRFGVESLDPVVYLTSSYYEKWMRATVNALIEKGLLTAEELDAKTEFYREHPEAMVPRREDPERLAQVRQRFVSAARTARRDDVDIPPRFKVGDAVRTRNIHPLGHTRLPRYVRGKQGVVAIYQGVQEFQDTVPGDPDPPPQPLYNVRFDAAELWGTSAEANQTLYIDMWESYLDSA